MGRYTSSAAQGEAILSFELSSEGCNSSTIDFELWVGKPQFEMVSEALMCTSASDTAFIVAYSPFEAGSLEWSSTGVINLGREISAYGIEFTASGEGGGTICASLDNECGTQQWCNLIYVDDDYCKSYYVAFEDSTIVLNDIMVYPNPTYDFVKLYFDNKMFRDRESDVKLTLFDVHGRIHKYKILKNIVSYHIVDLSQLADGTYYLTIQYYGGIARFKVVKI